MGVQADSEREKYAILWQSRPFLRGCMMTQSAYAHVADFYDVFVQTTLDIPFFVAEAGKTRGRILELMAG